jgi:endonuclease YncB( thermonuclease family)
VIDSETLALDDGSAVRLIGALAPRASDTEAADGKWPAEEAARGALDALATGKAVRLKFGGERKDRHGHWLAHVFLRDGKDGETWVQAHMLQSGHARAYALSGNRACMGELTTAEAVARSSHLGLWLEPAYRERAAIPARDIMRYEGTFQVVTGVVDSVRSSRDVIRLRLGTDWRRDLTVSIRTKDRDLLGAIGGDAKALNGRTIEARGWIGRRSGSFAGPDIDVSTAGDLKVVEPK